MAKKTFTREDGDKLRKLIFACQRHGECECRDEWGPVSPYCDSCKLLFAAEREFMEAMTTDMASAMLDHIEYWKWEAGRWKDPRD